MTQNEYTRALETLIMDDLIPMYIVGCRSKGINPNLQPLLKRLLAAKKKPNKVAYLLRPRHIAW